MEAVAGFVRDVVWEEGLEERQEEARMRRELQEVQAMEERWG
jgi:hypothetical protein